MKRTKEQFIKEVLKNIDFIEKLGDPKWDIWTLKELWRLLILRSKENRKDFTR